MNVSANQNSWEAKVVGSNGGNPLPCSLDGICSTDVMGSAFFWAIANSAPYAAARPPPAFGLPCQMLQCEQQQQRDQQREDAERLGHREAENEVAELALRRGRIAQRGSEIVAEDGADAHAGTAHADAGNTSADVFRGDRIHEKSSFSRC